MSDPNKTSPKKKMTEAEVKAANEEFHKIVDAATARADDVFVTARLLVGHAWPYLSLAVMKLVPRWSIQVPTVGVDRYMRLYMNPLFVASLTAPQFAVILAGHELQHVFGAHHARLVECRHRDIDLPGVGGKDPTGSGSFSNICHDLAINSGIEAYVESANAYRKANGLDPIPFEVPADGVYPKMYKDKHGKPLPVGLISEEYAMLLDHMPEPQPSRMRCVRGGTGSKGDKSCGSGGGDTAQPWEDPSAPDPGDPSTGVPEIEIEAVKKQAAVEAAAQERKQKGTVPAGLRLWAEAHLKPSKLPWQTLLRKAVRHGVNWTTGQADYTWRKRGRRSNYDVILPAMTNPEPSVVVAIDSSGSMGPKDYDAAFREIHAVLKAFGFDRVPVFTCDTRASEVQMVSAVTQIELVGGGGTDMGLAIDHAAKLKKKMVIVMTDGVTGYGSKPDRMKVLVCLTQDPPASYPVPSWADHVVCKD